MIKVAKITSEVKAQIEDTTYETNAFFNPVQDANANWCISLETAKHLPESDYGIIEWVAPVEAEEFKTVKK